MKAKTADPLVLASSSPRRREILAAMGFEFEVIPADIDEALAGSHRPVELAVELAERKAAAVAAAGSGSCVVAADTVVELNGVSLGKPSDQADARRMLQSLSGRSHLVHTGVAVHSDRHALSGVETTNVTFRQLSGHQIDDYVASGAAMDKAGAYGIQDSDLSPVSDYEGSYLNVVGLPVSLLARLLEGAEQIDAATAREISRKDSL